MLTWVLREVLFVPFERSGVRTREICKKVRGLCGRVEVLEYSYLVTGAVVDRFRRENGIIPRSVGFPWSFFGVFRECASWVFDCDRFVVLEVSRGRRVCILSWTFIDNVVPCIEFSSFLLRGI